MSTCLLATILSQLNDLTAEERRELFLRLRQEFELHQLEKRWNTSAEIILEALDRASELTQRMFRGVLAEAACKVEVIDRLAEWKCVPDHGNQSADFVIERNDVSVSIQAKLLRSTRGVPLRADQVRTLGSKSHYVVETQKTRSGRDPSGKDTRPYHFGEFDILAVSLYPLTGRWHDFLFAPSRWLIPRACDQSLIAVYQPVSRRPNDDWTDDLSVCIERHASHVRKTISGVVVNPGLRGDRA